MATQPTRRRIMRSAAACRPCRLRCMHGQAVGGLIHEYRAGGHSRSVNKKVSHRPWGRNSDFTQLYCEMRRDDQTTAANFLKCVSYLSRVRQYNRKRVLAGVVKQPGVEKFESSVPV